MKQLSALAIAELGIELQFAGRLWAYVAVVGENEPARLGIAVANQPGYTPVPEHWANGHYLEMVAEADRLNIARGLTLDSAMRIEASSMAAGKVPARAGGG